MPNRQFWLAVIFITIAVLAVVVLVFSLQQRPDGAIQPKSSPSPTPGSDIFSGMSIKIPVAGRNGVWELKVTQLERTDNIDLLTDVKGAYYENKALLYRIAAQKGQIYLNSRILEVSGAVRFESNDGKKITANQLTWDPNGQKIRARGRVRLETSRSVLTAEELAADLRLNRVVLSGKTHASYQR
jgi:LPS export ABC transporter protein LptC